MKKFRKLALAFLGAFLCVGVGVGAVVGAGEAKGVKAETKVTWDQTTAIPTTATAFPNDTVATIKRSNSNTYTSPLRIYSGNTVTISVATGYTITRVTYNASSTGDYVTYAQNATVSPSATPSVNDKAVTWTYTTSVSTFTFKPSGQTRTTGIDVYYESDTAASFTLDKPNIDLHIGETAELNVTLKNVTYSNTQISFDSNIINCVEKSHTDKNIVYTITALSKNLDGTTLTISDATSSAESKSCIVKVGKAAPAVLSKTFAEVLSDTSPEKSVLYKTTAIIKQFKNDTKDAYGNMTLTDGTKDVVVYGSTATKTAMSWNMLDEIFVFENPKDFLTDNTTKNLKVGDQLEIECFKYTYETTLNISCVITNTVIEEVTSLTVTPSKTQYNQGDSVAASDLTAVAVWAVSGIENVSFDKLTITPSIFTTAGQQTVTVSYQGKTDTYNVTVSAQTINIQSIDLGAEEVNIMSHEQTYSFNANVLPANHTENIIWTSSNISVATVDQTGKVTYVAPGETTITCAGELGTVSDSCTIKCYVSTKYLSTTSISLTASDFKVGSSYADSDFTKGGVRFLANTMKSSKNAIQIRAKSASGIVTTSSIGPIVAVNVAIDTTVTTENKLCVYGSKTAYSGTNELYDESKMGTLIGTVEESGAVSLNLEEGPYNYIGFRGNNGATYSLSITITFATYYYSTYEDMEAINDFMDADLLMNDYDVGGKKGSTAGDGTCTEIWSDVKSDYNKLTADQKGLFNNDSAYADAKERFTEWARINGDTINDDYTLSNTNTALSSVDNATITVTIILCVAAAWMLTVIVIRSYKKRKHEAE